MSTLVNAEGRTPAPERGGVKATKRVLRSQDITTRILYTVVRSSHQWYPFMLHPHVWHVERCGGPSARAATDMLALHTPHTPSSIRGVASAVSPPRRCSSHSTSLSSPGPTHAQSSHLSTRLPAECAEVHAALRPTQSALSAATTYVAWRYFAHLCCSGRIASHEACTSPKHAHTPPCCGPAGACSGLAPCLQHIDEPSPLAPTTPQLSRAPPFTVHVPVDKPPTERGM